MTVCSNILILSLSPSGVSFFLFVLKHVNIETCTYYILYLLYTVYQYKTKYMRQSDNLLTFSLFFLLTVYCTLEYSHAFTDIYRNALYGSFKTKAALYEE
jgi:hypothetical protein